MVLALTAFKATLGLLITFGGLGIVVNGIVVYLVVQALGERAENRRLRNGEDPAAEL